MKRTAISLATRFHNPARTQRRHKVTGGLFRVGKITRISRQAPQTHGRANERTTIIGEIPARQMSVKIDIVVDSPGLRIEECLPTPREKFTRRCEIFLFLCDEREIARRNHRRKIVAGILAFMLAVLPPHPAIQRIVDLVCREMVEQPARVYEVTRLLRVAIRMRERNRPPKDVVVVFVFEEVWMPARERLIEARHKRLRPPRMKEFVRVNQHFPRVRREPEIKRFLPVLMSTQVTFFVHPVRREEGRKRRLRACLERLF